ncbi:MAG: nicotinate-nicotinamide nucleotide adenylyltransferase [Parcubacteria group bacterium]|nr:nicotinate-nicotinamide nucleotide adenylyltransferase [Parcubacteria group bacterium]
MENKKKKIVIYGGAFNPPHLGHAIAIESTMRLFPCDQIVLMPSGDRADKMISDTVSGNHRFTMLEIMRKELFSNPKTHIINSVFEIGRQGLTNTNETKKAMEQAYPGFEYYFLIGSENLFEIRERWVNGKELWGTTNFIVIPRPSSFAEASADKRGEFPKEIPPKCEVLRIDVAMVDISSTLVRKLISQGDSGIPYITPGVAEFIKNYGLYGALDLNCGH